MRELNKVKSKIIKAKAILASAMIALITLPSVNAVEGMFTPEQLPEIQKQLRQAGLKISTKDMTDLTGFPMGAVISLGGCSASFVSDKGLVITNHHCARGSIQFNSTEENNYLEDGFNAKKLSDELPAAPGSRVYVTKQVTDVTDKVLTGLSDEMSGAEREKIIDSNSKALLAECEKDAGHRCQVSSFFGGAQYKLNKRLEIKDVRLVHAPGDAIGRYGGDIDNWLWPRHTGDYAFYRAYVSAQGKSAEYSKDNVPYEPEHFLTVSAKGVEEGDFVMVAGYPGSTSRYSRLARVNNVFNWTYPAWQNLLTDWVEAINTASQEGSDARIKYESRLAGLNNFLKNIGGQISGAERVGLVDRRKQREQALDAWIASSKDADGFKQAIAALDELTEESAAAARKSFWYQNAKRPSLLSAARRLYRLSKENQKPDAQREQGYQERDMAFFKQSMQAIERRYDPKVDKAEWLVFLKGYMEQPSEQRVSALDEGLKLGEEFDADRLSNKLESFYEKTQLGNVNKRLDLMNSSPADFELSDDPFIKLAVALYEEDIQQENAEKDRKGRFAELEPQYMQAIMAWQKSKGFVAYPDANSNLRVTYGNVMGGFPKDGLRYTAFTTLEGIKEKDTGISPFNSPKSQLALIDAKDYGDYELDAISSVPVNFMSDIDITGGNSGSATLNGRGELVGLVFDGTIESVNSDWDFDQKMTRAIHVDSRYMLWVMEKIDDAQHLIDEMNIID